MDQFKKQLAEEVIGEDSLVEVEIGKGEYVTLYIPIDSDEAKEHSHLLRSVGVDSEAGALAVFDHNPDRTPEDQLAAWQNAGFTINDLIRVYGVESRAAGERLGEFRYKG